MSNLDEHIREAFLALTVSEALRTRLPERRARTPLSRWVLAAAGAVTLTVVASQALDLAQTAPGSGGLASSIVRSPFIVHPLDTWVSPGSAVQVFSVHGTVALDYGVQRLAKDGVALELMDPGAWGNGPSGVVRMARVSGPLREVGVEEPETLEGLESGGVLFADMLEGLRSFQLLRLTSGRVVIRSEAVYAGDLMVDDGEACSVAVAGTLTQIRVVRTDRIRREPDLLVYDAYSGLPFGRYRQWGGEWRDGWLRVANLRGPLDLRSEQIRVGVPLHSMVGLAMTTEAPVRTGDRVHVVGPDSALVASDVGVEVSEQGIVWGLFDPVSVPGVIRAGALRGIPTGE